VAPLSRGRELLESSVRYALAGAGMVTPQLLGRPTPCAGWDVVALLAHLSDSIAVLHEAIAGPGAGRLLPVAPGGDPVAQLRGRAVRLLSACAAADPAQRPVVLGGRELTASMVMAAGALEISVHGWDVAAACAGPPAPPVPAGLAVVLLTIAPLLVPPGTRPGLFAGPVQLSGPAAPSDHLVAFLGREPR